MARLARHGVDFIREHCFDTDGRMFFSLTREGRPLRKRRYIFSEIFAIIALAAYGKAGRDDRSKKQALDLFKRVLGYLETPGALPPKINPEVRPMKGLAMPMSLLVTAQELRKAVADPLFDRVIDRNIAEIERDFMKPEFKCVLETVGPNGEFLDNFDGRLVIPGTPSRSAGSSSRKRACAAATARLIDIGHEDHRLVVRDRLGPRVRRASSTIRDARGLPVTEYWHDMKFWWPHNEAIIGTLLAYQLTGDEKYARWHAAVHDWAHAHFADPVHGEWFGYLHRDGRVSTRLKGNMWKGSSTCRGCSGTAGSASRRWESSEMDYSARLSLTSWDWTICVTLIAVSLAVGLLHLRPGCAPRPTRAAFSWPGAAWPGRSSARRSSPRTSAPSTWSACPETPTVTASAPPRSS